MLSYLASLGVWNWFILGVLLLLVEVIAPGTFMIWLGLSAILVGLISLIIDWPWQFQFVAFAAFSIGSILLWRKLNPKADSPELTPLLNRRGDTYVGRIFTLEKPIVDGVGTVRIGDSIWQIRGDDCPAGTRIRVVAAEGGTLVVGPAE
jgi:membrane protein implicated in regulation of membrane protease activity